jgi:hypothetical protein
MSNGHWLMKAFKTISFVLVLGASMSGCADTLSWQEDVQLLDGRVITVMQKRRYEGAYDGQSYGAIPREAWLTFKLPEFSNQDITWHENLSTQVLNVYEGKLYVVGFGPTCLEFNLYGKPKPPYVGFQYKDKKWVRIPFTEIPAAIFGTNLWVDNSLPNKSGRISLGDKVLEMKDPTLPKHLKKIDPLRKSNCA